MYRIYIVEDDPTISSLAAQGIAGWGYEVMEAQDFRHILEEFQTFQPDLVLLDIGLPFYNGSARSPGSPWCFCPRPRTI